MARIVTVNRYINSPNILFNGDFEIKPSVLTAATNTGARWIDGTAGGSNAVRSYGWAVTPGAIANAEVGFDTTVFRSGAASLKLSHLTTGGNITCGSYKQSITSSTLHELTSALPSTEYTLTGYIRTNNVASNGVFIDVREFNASGGTVTTTSTNKLSGTDTSFRTATATFTTQSSTRFVIVFLRLNVVGNICDVWFDDITLRRTNGLGRTAA